MKKFLGVKKHFQKYRFRGRKYRCRYTQKSARQVCSSAVHPEQQSNRTLSTLHAIQRHDTRGKSGPSKIQHNVTVETSQSNSPAINSVVSGRQSWAFAVCGSAGSLKSYFQANLTIKISYFWDRPTKITSPNQIHLENAKYNIYL